MSARRGAATHAPTVRVGHDSRPPGTRRGEGAASTERERTRTCVSARRGAATHAPAVLGGLCHHRGVNPLDAGAIALLLLAILLGWRSGALPQIAGLAGAALGVVLGLLTVPRLLPFLVEVPSAVRAGAVIVLLLGLVGIGEAIGARLGRAASTRLGVGLLGAMDRVGGAAIGAAQALLIVWLAGGILATGAVPQLGQVAQTSKTVRAIAVLLPSPTEIVVELGKALDQSGLPDVFLGLERLPAEAIDLPDDPVAEALGRAAAASVPRIQAEACLTRSTGTGIAVAPGYVLTNAHVVAGARSVTVDTPIRRWDAVVVYYDPDLDIAVLRVDGFAPPSLIFATADPSRGALGATIGYPGGGDAVVEPAAVTATYDAEGLDVTGTERVTRRIIELRAVVEPGDSGGPLLLVDGTIGGVVFAESRSDETVGYALSPTAVAIALRPAIGLSLPVDTGPCLH
ncbi:MAG: MarP family serine protease [Chloroflexota bacterium]|nr:MAG: MarP family serine protease [Chloroflexota bacterium]